MKISLQTGMFGFNKKLSNLNFGFNRPKLVNGIAKNYDVFEKQSDVCVKKENIPSVNEFMDYGWYECGDEGNSYRNKETGTKITIQRSGQDTILNVEFEKEQPQYSNFDDDCCFDDYAPQQQTSNLKQKILIISKDGLFYREKEPDERYIDEHKKFIRLEEKPASYDLEDIERFLSKDNFRGQLVFCTNSPVSPGHAEIDLPQGQNYIVNENGSDFSIMQDYRAKKKPERIVYHYSDGRVAITDLALDVIVAFKPNKDKTGMTIRKMVGDEEIHLTSEIKDNNVKIINEKTGNSFQVPISFFSCNPTPYIYSKSNLVSDEQREEKMIELFKKLSPTTILDLIKFKTDNPKASFPYLLSDKSAAYYSGISIPLKDVPQTVSHEALHFVSEKEDLLTQLQGIHDNEMQNSKGLIGFLAQYAADGYKKDYQRGLNELISIVGTADIYGQEHGGRTEAARIVFPKTSKAFEQLLMKHYNELICEFIEKQ